jgi:hypothetical protein
MPVALEIMLPKDILWQGVPKPLQFIMFTPHAHCRYQRDQLVASSTVILIAVRWSPKRILAGCTHKDAVAVWLEFLEHIIKTQLTAWMINPWLVKSVLANPDAEPIPSFALCRVSKTIFMHDEAISSPG